MICFSYTIQPDDLAEFGACKQEVRADVHRWLGILKRVAAAPKGQGKRVMEAEAKLAGTSHGSVRAKWYDYQESGDWRVLVNRAKQGSTNGDRGNLSATLIAHFTDLCLANQRVASAAYDKLIEDYRAGVVIPGHGSWRDHYPHRRCCPPELPAGWSKRTFYRHAPERESFIALAARQGRSAASVMRLKVHTTRVGLAIGQEYQIDDQEYDVPVNFLAPGAHQSRAMRPLGLDGLELLSTVQLLNGFLPTLWDARTEKKQKPLERYVPWFLLGMLTVGGINESTGTTITCEHGTAAVRDLLEKALYDHTGGKVRIVRGGIDRRSSHAGLFDSRGRGNFRVKATLEGSRNLLRNKMADTLLFPGATGLDRDHAPAELAGRERYNERVINAAVAVGMRDDVAELLVLPFLEWSQFVALTVELYRVINTRTDHRIEGWQECQFMVNEWRPARELPWQSMDVLLRMPDDAQAACRALIATDEALRNSRRMNPQEVWERGRGVLTPLPEPLVPLLLPPDGTFGVERDMDDEDCFTWTDSALSTRPYRFLARVGGRLLPRDRYMTYCNPFAPGKLIVCDAKGRYLGACPAYDVASRADAEAVHRAQGLAAKLEKEKLAPLARLGARMGRQLLEASQTNAAALHGRRKADAAPVQTADRDTIRRERATAFDAADFDTHPDAGSQQNAPAAYDGEGVWWPAAEQPDTEVPGAGAETYRAEDFF